MPRTVRFTPDTVGGAGGCDGKKPNKGNGHDKSHSQGETMRIPPQGKQVRGHLPSYLLSGEAERNALTVSEVDFLAIKPSGSASLVKRKILNISGDHGNGDWGLRQYVHDSHCGKMPDLRRDWIDTRADCWNKRQIFPINEHGAFGGRKFFVYFTNHASGPSHRLAINMRPELDFPVYNRIFVAEVTNNSIAAINYSNPYVQFDFRNFPHDLPSNAEFHDYIVKAASRAYFQNSQDVTRPWERQ